MPQILYCWPNETKRKGAPENSPWHLEHVNIHGSNVKTKEYDKSRVCLDSEIRNQNCQ